MIALLRAVVRFVLSLLGRGAPLPPPPQPGPGGDELQIDYAPRRDGDADPGEVVWTWVPFDDDPSRGKDRPVLVIGRRAGRLVGLALTSVEHDRRDRVEVGMGAWDREGRASWAKLDRLIDLSGGIRREGAVLDRARFDDVVRAYRAFIA